MAYVRTNKSNYAYFDDVPFARGSFKKVYRGYYTDGPRYGQVCVSKVPIPRSIFGNADFEVDLKVIRKTREIIDAWNARRFIKLPIVLSMPDLWTDQRTGERRLIEPFIQDFQKFNSNNGRVYHQGTFWSNVLQALSHFSHHVSFGQMVLCDIQGGIYPHRL